MDRAKAAAVTLITILFLLTPATATNVPATQVAIANLWTNLGPGSNPFAGPNALVADSPQIKGPFTLPSLHPFSGTYTTQVFKDKNGYLVFAYQINLKPSPPNPKNADVQKISTGDWDDSIKVNAELWVGTAGPTGFGVGTVKPSGINRINGVITMYFQNPLLLAGKQSYDLLLYTNAKKYTADTIGIQDGAGTTVSGFVPVAPEPATVSLLGFGLLGLGAARKRLRK